MDRHTDTHINKYAICVSPVEEEPIKEDSSESDASGYGKRLTILPNARLETLPSLHFFATTLYLSNLLGESLS